MPYKRRRRARKKRLFKKNISNGAHSTMLTLYNYRPFKNPASKIKYVTTILSEVLASNATNVEVAVRTNFFMNYPGSWVGDNSVSFTQASASSNPTRLARLMQCFDMYRVLAMSVKWVPTQNVNNDQLVGLGAKGETNTLYMVYDPDDYAGNTELQYQNLAGTPMSVFRPHTKKFRNMRPPLMNTSNYQAVQTAGFVTAASTNNNPTVQNSFGCIKTFVDNVAANGGGGTVIAGHFWCEYLIEFYGVNASQA